MNFSALPTASSSRAFLASFLLHCLAIVLMGTVWASSPEVRQFVEHATLVAPLPEHSDRPVLPKPARIIKRAAFVLPIKPLSQPVAILPAPPIASASKPASVAWNAPPLPAPRPVVPAKPPIRTDVFAAIVPPPVTNSKPALPVEMGAFQVAMAGENAVAKMVVARTGMFDGGERQTRGTAAPAVTVASAGFGDGRVTEAVGRVRPLALSHRDAGFGAMLQAKTPVQTEPAVRAGGFDSRLAPTPPKPRMDQAMAREVEILCKPRPAYTEEARKLKIEGEVVVEVVFAASGEVKVLRIVQGLGHGLDEAATQAAANIRFKPAERGGTRVDSTALAHIKFQLAY